MITEDYVCFETAKLLEERGFDERCVCYYNTESLNKFGHPVFDSIDMPLSNSDLEQSDHDYVCYSAPTLQMAMKWLREVHNKSIEVRSQGLKSTGLGWVTEIYDLKTQDEEYHNPFTKPSCEEACEAGIRYCLENLI